MLTRTELRSVDFMTTEMITIEADDSIHAAAALLIDNGISGAPVRDEFGRIIGLISLRDIARFEREKPFMDLEAESAQSQRAQWSSSQGKKGRVPWGYHLEAQGNALVSDFMTPIVISLPQDSPVQAVVRTMLKRKVHRVLMSDSDGTIVGIISALDILRAMAGDG